MAAFDGIGKQKVKNWVRIGHGRGFKEIADAGGYNLRAFLRKNFPGCGAGDFFLFVACDARLIQRQRRGQRLPVARAKNPPSKRQKNDYRQQRKMQHGLSPLVNHPHTRTTRNAVNPSSNILT